MRNGRRVKSSQPGPVGSRSVEAATAHNRTKPTAREFRLIPRSGEVLRVTRAASVQFAASPLLFRIIRVHDWSTYDGWAWLDGYELNASGEAVSRRSIFVKVRGLQPAGPPGSNRPPTVVLGGGLGDPTTGRGKPAPPDHA